MALDHVRHVEAIAIIKALCGDGDLLVPPSEYHRTALKWCEENHPPPEAYTAAIQRLAAQPTEDT